MVSPVTERTVERTWIIVWKVTGFPEWAWDTSEESAMVAKIKSLQAAGGLEWYHVSKRVVWTDTTEEDVKWLNDLKASTE